MRVPVFRIEGLSDGVDTGMVDDFTGQVLAQPNAKVPMTSDSRARAKSQALAAKRAQILVPILHKSVLKPFKRRV